LLKQAAIRLDNGAINDFANYYDEGTWVPKNESKALRLTVIAAERGVVSAKQRLEKCPLPSASLF
jgi:TPR repeat protein